jgi:hypothetical protein
MMGARGKKVLEGELNGHERNDDDLGNACSYWCGFGRV